MRGRLRGAAAQERFTRELREARLNLGKSQAVAAREAGITASVWSRLERGSRETLTLTMVGRMAAAVGLDFVPQFYPASIVLNDAAQVGVLRDIRVQFGPNWWWRHEVLVAVPPDQRAWDAVGTHRSSRLRVCVEGETRFRDCQATMRRVEAKRVAGGEPRLVLAIRDSHHNRQAVAAARLELATAFPIGAREAMAALRRGEDPGGDVLLMVPWVRAGDAALPSR